MTARRTAIYARTRAREGIRTPNLLIRSQMLYPLSYARIFSFVEPVNPTFFCLRAQFCPYLLDFNIDYKGFIKGARGNPDFP